ncbi:zinc finger, c4 type (two domains) domain-containing protein [Ditylenchus destructor]|uniref:Zinc finger, c4 type (Two domains) domain-containing protein n=1 Tax=Ditylenchus destructor TaxID=166010 RepID=A0AAD4MMT0_9BILA|nr:zinc finger, c4 type (two domains) domain-containing protein [Ditylenchus destructor]
MQAVNDDHPNTNASGSTTSHESLSSVSSSKALGTSVVSLEYLTSTSGELQNGQLKPKNFSRDVEMPTKCLVCGHPTNCCNYDVPSCNGCKAFFRRSLFESKTYECKLNGMCSRMHGANRCRACRFDRCVLAGMNLRAIQFPVSVDVAKLSDKVANRKRYLSQKYGERCPVLIGTTSLVFEETIESKTIQSLVYVELKVRQIRESSRWLSEAVIFRSIPELLSSPENVLARADQYPKELNWPLTYDEALKIEESERRPCWISLDTFLCIEMARTMTVFSQLEYNDQKALLEHMTLANEILLEAFYSYQMKSETFIMPSGFLPTVMTMEEFVLLKAIIYSHSAIHGLSERGRVLLEKESIRYSRTLMKHLQSRLGAVPGAKKYAEIVFFVGCLFYGAQQLRGIHIYVHVVWAMPGSERREAPLGYLRASLVFKPACISRRLGVGCLGVGCLGVEYLGVGCLGVGCLGVGCLGVGCFGDGSLAKCPQAKKFDMCGPMSEISVPFALTRRELSFDTSLASGDG